jgi:hypothetical protein
MPGSLDFEALFDELANWKFWVVLVITLVFGALGGFVYELIALQGMIERGHTPEEDEVVDFPHATHKFVYDLGIGARMIIGAMAALIALWVITPDTTFAWLAVAVIAGSAGTAVFRSMQDRLLAVIKTNQVAELNKDIQQLGEQVEQIQQAANKGQNDEVARVASAAQALVSRRTR